MFLNFMFFLQELLKFSVDPIEVNDLQVSIDAMLSVLKHVNDVMHTDAIIGFTVTFVPDTSYCTWYF